MEQFNSETNQWDVVYDNSDGMFVSIRRQDNGYVVVRGNGNRCPGIGRRFCEIMGLDGAGKETRSDVSDIVASGLVGHAVTVFAWMEVSFDFRLKDHVLTERMSRKTTAQICSFCLKTVNALSAGFIVPTWLYGSSPLQPGWP